MYDFGISEQWFWQDVFNAEIGYSGTVQRRWYRAKHGFHDKESTWSL